MGGCRDVAVGVDVAPGVVIVSADLARLVDINSPPKALSIGSACSLGYPKVETPTKRGSTDPNTPGPPTEGWPPAGRSSGWVNTGPADSVDTGSDPLVNSSISPTEIVDEDVEVAVEVETKERGEVALFHFLTPSRCEPWRWYNKMPRLISSIKTDTIVRKDPVIIKKTQPQL